ncbi:phosphatase PAP2 family protein [Acidaminobacterium chupaoyuni]
MKKKSIQEKLKLILPSKKAIVPLIVVLVWNSIVYNGCHLLMQNQRHFCLELSMEQQIPLLPWTSAIYLGCYAFWVINYILCTKNTTREMYRFLCADFVAKGVCLLFFVFLPTTIQRPEVVASDWGNALIALIYRYDAADNLFPSIHCLASWLCYVGVRGKSWVPRWYQKTSLINAIFVCISTLTTKQHVLVDVAGGILLAELAYWLAAKPQVYTPYIRLIRWIEKLLLQLKQSLFGQKDAAVR